MIRAIQSAEMVGGNTPLFVGRSGERYQSQRTDHSVSHLHSVAYGIDIGVGCAHVFIHRNGSACAER